MPKGPSPDDHVPRSRDWVLIAVLALALALRLWRIADQSLWFDEGWSIHVAQQTLPEALAQLGTEGHTHPPGYYVLLMAWVRLWGDSALAARGLSACLGVIAVWLTYRLGKQLVDEQVGLTAAALLAINPAHIVYSQETRMYTMLGAVLTGLWLLYLRLAQSKPTARQWRFWLVLLLAQTLAIYTHFFAVFALFTMVFWTLPILLADRSPQRWPRVAAWGAVQGLTLIAFAPWLGTALQRAATHTTLDTTAPRLSAFAQETWTFLLGGHIALMGREPLFRTLAQASLAMVVALSLWLLLDRRRRSQAAYLVVQTLASAGALFVMMQLKPGYHPRYLLMILPPLVILVALGLVTLWRKPRAIGLAAKTVAGATLLLWLATQGIAAQALQTDAYYRRDDARATMALLESSVPANTPILLSIDDWAIKYYAADTRLAVHVVDASRPADEVMAQVEQAVANHDRAVMIEWYQGTSDLRGILPYVLEQRGQRIEREALPAYTVLVYALQNEPAHQVLGQPAAHFAGIEIIEVLGDSDVPADDALAIRITWQVHQALPPDLKVALQLLDPGGHEIVTDDTLLRDAQGLRSQHWQLGQVVQGFYRLALPAGLAPVTYTLQSGLYHEAMPEGLDVLDQAGAPAGKHARLVQIALSPPTGTLNQVVTAESLGLEPVPGEGQAAPGLWVLGYGVNDTTFDTGEMVKVALAWQAQQPLTDHLVTLQLVRDGQTLAQETQAPVYGLYPTSLWRPEQVVREYRQLLISPQLAAGPAALQVWIQGHDPIDLCELTLTAIARSYARPAPAHVLDQSLGSLARLIGYDLDQEQVSNLEPVALTLYWQALGASKAPQVIFTHLLDNQGRLIAQHDGVACQGQRPTTGWAPGEYLVDKHELTWVDPAYVGVATIELGMYDPTSGQRLLTGEGNTRVLLPTELVVTDTIENQ